MLDVRRARRPPCDGCPVGERVGLDVADLDLDSRASRVFGTRGKDGRERSVPLGVPAVEAVSAWQERGRPALRGERGGAVSRLGVRGRRLDRRAERSLAYARLADLRGVHDLGPLGLRYTAVTHLIEGGTGFRSVQELLGHATLATT
ncbi:tyrosine-type recombinase/integrase [Streptomycetaceae bacterium NBC_01309]